MSPEALKLNEPCRFYKGQVGAGGYLWAYQLGKSSKEPGPYDGVDKREDQLKAARTTWASAAAEGTELPPEQRPRK
jgi:hypothetical protein